ncbi:tRNA (adenosine(37)-N6)-dimethylallyltransferase MiaA [Aureibacter tunicatorum]|uniref:tRNA dimethylallyltransferase n=1 Tax=Aureibacter tunicatorum TaxID=866807 RepID=A0AAE3XJM7_9BACT|nr:tRNA (adenosine(37)-N6)-dimethylallyltransferase MiaA [Aureibacter tunicatorum]MDR6237344.1 tRNA dimethylallyltransferase [Aureibacter tunicatorum]BDD06335.1 tRNA dimethylallyltransferase 2 [Aureibacter tunicatorum]
MNADLITILGPTAIGKTSLAVNLAYYSDGEVISADSRQVYKGMDIGTGKDIAEYVIKGQNIPYHLIDIVDPGYEYNVFEFQKDFLNSYEQIQKRGKIPILCGGTGMYLDAVFKGYRLMKVPESSEVRDICRSKSDEELAKWLMDIRNTHNKTDITNRERTIRAIEIELYQMAHRKEMNDFPKINHLVFGIKADTDLIKKRITIRLKDRLENGLIEEVQRLLDEGLSPEQLKFYGLEYKVVTEHVIGQLNKNDMFQKLNSAIHNFAKKQMTWFRKMEREGMNITWLDANANIDDKLKTTISKMLKH